MKASKDGLGGPFKLGPEVWISFNPELDDDEVYDRYVIKKDNTLLIFCPMKLLEKWSDTLM
jgi:hypothetical protein